jgi:redox-sensitive bicupin YhaK (pirin superfamily)
MQRRMVGPFIFFDHLGPVELPKGLGREADVRPHPHIGLSTVTYLFAGEIVHRDSTGDLVSSLYARFTEGFETPDLRGAGSFCSR